MKFAIAAQVLDLITFIPAVMRWGIYYETNPLMRTAHEIGGIGGVVIVKAVAIVAMVAILAYFAPRNKTTLVAGIVIMTIIGTLGWLSNVASLVIA